ncbi:MAG: type IV pilin [Candidatus Aenigmarchaeota archaeon]|nr:type IV pilin [Candidatus Aenigmarchaeota archaeon]
MTRKSKGISPLVAVIMLIAFTMIVAGILAGWATRFATEQRSILEKCVRANIVIKRATYAAGNLSVMLYNAGTVPLTNFQVQVTYNSKGPPMPSTWTIYDSIDANSFETFSHNVTNTSIDFVEMRSVECQGAYDLIRSYDVVGLP